MNRGGGWRGGRGGSSGNGDQGGGNRRGNGRGTVVRFPSDSNRRDAGRDLQPRFPSDSNAKDNSYSVGSQAPAPGRVDRRNNRDNQARDNHPGGSRERTQREGTPQNGRQARDGGRSQGGRGPRFRGDRHDQRPQPENAAAPINLDLVNDVSEDAVDAQGALQQIDPFELFCAFHLGITRDDTYRQPNLNDIAKRFGVAPGLIKQALQANRMDPDTVLTSGFDMALAQIDIQVSPPGVSKTELARGLYEEYLQAVRGREWPEPVAEEAVNALV